MVWIAPLLFLMAVSPASAQTAPAAPVSEQKRTIDNYCAIDANRASVLCTARLKGAARVTPVDLAASVAIGEAQLTSPITPDEITDCWATWVAINEHIRTSGRGTFPADYTQAKLATRIAEWRSAVGKAFRGRDADERRASETEMLGKRRADVAGPRIVMAARTSGNCKQLPAD